MGVLFFEHSDLSASFLIVGRFCAYLQGLCFRKLHALLLGESHKAVFEIQSCSHLTAQGIVVEVGIGNGGEQSVNDDLVHLFGQVYPFLVHGACC